MDVMVGWLSYYHDRLNLQTLQQDTSNDDQGLWRHSATTLIVELTVRYDYLIIQEIAMSQ